MRECGYFCEHLIATKATNNYFAFVKNIATFVRLDCTNVFIDYIYKI